MLKYVDLKCSIDCNFLSNSRAKIHIYTKKGNFFFLLKSRDEEETLDTHTFNIFDYLTMIPKWLCRKVIQLCPGRAGIMVPSCCARAQPRARILACLCGNRKIDHLQVRRSTSVKLETWNKEMDRKHMTFKGNEIPKGHTAFSLDVRLHHHKSDLQTCHYRLRRISYPLSKNNNTTSL